MNGLLESIARRRRASVSNGTQPTIPQVNGTTPPREPAAVESPAASSPPVESAKAPGFLERGRLRRRARYLRQLREVQLRDLGGFLVELHRLGRQRPELVRAKVDAAAATDAELRGLDQGLATGDGIRQPGLGGACAKCAAVYGSRDRFCASCGNAVTEG